MTSLVAYRISAWDTPFWVSANRASRRFNKAGRGPVQYWSLHPLTPWAEIMRGHGLVTSLEANELRQRVWAARLTLPSITEISFDNAPDFGLEPHHLVADDYGACQEFGERCLRGEGPKVITVPSAALPGTRNLVIFDARVLVPYLMEPVGEVDSPASIAAEEALPPEALLPQIRHFSEEHKGLKAWERNEVFTFREPQATRLD